MRRQPILWPLEWNTPEHMPPKVASQKCQNWELWRYNRCLDRQYRAWLYMGKEYHERWRILVKNVIKKTSNVEPCTSAMPGIVTVVVVFAMFDKSNFTKFVSLDGKKSSHKLCTTIIKGLSYISTRTLCMQWFLIIELEGLGVDLRSSSPDDVQIKIHIEI